MKALFSVKKAVTVITADELHAQNWVFHSRKQWSNEKLFLKTF